MDKAEKEKLVDDAASDVVAVCKSVLEEDPSLSPVITMQFGFLRHLAQLRAMARELSPKQRELVQRVTDAIEQASLNAMSQLVDPPKE